MQPGAQTVVAVIDRSASMRGHAGLAPALEPLITQAAGVYSTLSVLIVGGEGELPRWAVDNLPLNSEEFEFDTMHYNEAVDLAAMCVAERIGDPIPTAEGTDLGTAIQVSADRLATATGPRTLIVVSDGLSNAGPISLTGMIGQSAVDTAVSALDAADYRPDLHDVDVTFASLGVTEGSLTAGSSVTWLQNYFLAVCVRAGAQKCAAPVADQGAAATAVSPRADLPNDPDLGLPAMQFEFGESEVRFALDSSAITAEADTALGEVAACIQVGSTLTVIGHADNTGGDPEHNRELSAMRSQAVAHRILELAGHPAVTVTALGVGSDEPKSATGDQPEDRRVSISLTGVCG